MTQSHAELVRFSSDLKRIVTDLDRHEQPADVLAIGHRISALGVEITAATERAFVLALEGVAA